MSTKKKWWCTNCKRFVDSKDVTFNESHVTCGCQSVLIKVGKSRGKLKKLTKLVMALREDVHKLEFRLRAVESDNPKLFERLSKLERWRKAGDNWVNPGTKTRLFMSASAAVQLPVEERVASLEKWRAAPDGLIAPEELNTTASCVKVVGFTPDGREVIVDSLSLRDNFTVMAGGIPL